MGDALATICRTCRIAAPALGDCGVIGLPSAAEHEGDPEQDLPPSFGYVYAGLEAIGMLTAQLTGYMAFLVAHSGHDLRVATEDEDTSAIDFSSVEIEPPNAVTCRFEQKCYDCRRRRLSQVPEDVITRPERELTPAQIDLFCERVPPVLVDFAYRAEPFGTDEAAKVAGFLRQHPGHRVVTNYLPEADVPAE